MVWLEEAPTEEEDRAALPPAHAAAWAAKDGSILLVREDVGRLARFDAFLLRNTASRSE